jgi:hypothetical protein
MCAAKPLLVDPRARGFAHPDLVRRTSCTCTPTLGRYLQ